MTTEEIIIYCCCEAAKESNKVWGMSYELASIVVPVLIFILGLLFQYLFYAIKRYFERNNTKNTFNNIIKSIINNCSLNSKYSKNLYDKLDFSTFYDCSLPTSRITFVDNIFQLDFFKVNDAYNHSNFLICNKKKRVIKPKAYSIMWDDFESLKYLNNIYLKDFDNFNDDFQILQNKFNTEWDKFLVKKTDMYKAICKNPQDKYYTEIINVIKEFSEKKFPNEINSIYPTYHNLIIQLLKVNNDNVSVDVEIHKILLELENIYKGADKLIAYYNNRFFQYYLAFHQSERLLKKCYKCIN